MTQYQTVPNTVNHTLITVEESGNLAWVYMSHINTHSFLISSAVVDQESYCAVIN